MKWADIGKAVGAAAPVISGLLLGPAGAAAGTLVAKVLGVDPTPDDVMRAIQGNPESLLKLKELQIGQETELAKLATEATVALAQQEVADRRSARDRQVALKDHVPAYLAVGTLILFAFVNIALLFCAFPQDNKDLLIGTSKTLENLVIMALGYYLGASLQKDKETVQFISRTPLA